MAQNIAVPDIGDFKEVEVIEVLVKPGDQINKNDTVVTIESDKSSVEIPSPEGGKIKDLKVKGANFTAKQGTMVRGITLTDNPEHIEGKVNGTRIVLVSAYLKKA